MTFATNMISEQRDAITGRVLKPQEQAYIEDQTRVLPAAQNGNSDIVNFFTGKHVFLTGATGFIGKLCLEKILRTCPDVEGVFVMCREKKGKSMMARSEDLLNDTIFDRVHSLNPKCRHKIISIKGDMGDDDLGISIEDRALLTSKVNIIIHCAATVRFDEKLRIALNINVRGIRHMMQMARECKNFQSFVLVSTAYSNCINKFIDETYYDFPIEFDDLDSLLKQKSDEEIERLRLFGPWPNTYTFTKALAEDLVKKEAGSLPIAVYRPSIVVSTYCEPIRGWIDNFYGPTGIVTAAGLGILRTMHCNSNNIAELVPADFVVNSILAVAYKTYKSHETTTSIVPMPPTIYNYVSSTENPLTYDQFMEMNKFYGLKVPTTKSFWYYSFRCNKYYVVHLLYSILLHWIPAYLIDGLGMVVGKQWKMVKMYSKIHKFAHVIAYFSTNRWYFKNNNIQALWAQMSDVDKKLFPFDIKLVDWEMHSYMNIFGVRTYIIKDPPETLPLARKRWNRLFVLHVIVKFSVLFALLRMVYVMFSGWFSDASSSILL